MSTNFIQIINYSHFINKTQLMNKRSEEIYKKYSEFTNFIENLLKSKIEFSSEGFVNRDIKSFSDLIIFIVKIFFEVYFELDFSKREHLIEIISKFLIKLKRIEIINLILAHLQFINEVKNAIKFDYMKNCEFDYENDIKIICEEAINDQDDNYTNDGFLLKLNLFNENEEKNNYLKSAIGKVFKFNESSNFYIYKLQSTKEGEIYSNKNIIEIEKKYKYLKINEIKIQKILTEKKLLKIKESSESLILTNNSNTYCDSLSNPILNLKESFLFLERDLAKHIKFTKRNTSNFKKAFEDLKLLLLQNLNSQINPMYHNIIMEIIPFGSVTQFSHNIKSDLEITVLTTENLSEINNLDLMMEIQTVITNFPYRYNKIELRNTKRTKLLNFYDIINNVKIELMLDNYLGILNSHLVRSYCLIDSHCIILINIIKDWSKIKKLNGNFDGYLSSYCYTLMVIFFLQNLKAPILPVLQTNVYYKFCKNEIFVKNSNSQNFRENLFSHFYLNFDDGYYDYHNENIYDDENYIRRKNNSPISGMLLKFFIFYLYLFDENEYCIDISNRNSVYRYNQIKFLNYYNNKQFVYCFLDPFDYSYNPGCYMIKNSYQEERFKKGMENAIDNILQRKSIFE